VVEPRVSVITDIAIDHQKFLGETIAEIAKEKVGIIRAGGVVVTLPQIPEANDVIGHAILDLDAKAVSAVPYVPPVSPGAPNYFKSNPLTTEGTENTEGTTRTLSHYPLQVMGKQILVETSLIGRHQLRNLALAVAAAEELSKQGFAITPDTIERGIRETRWPGRFEVIPGSPEFVLDVAHNPAGAWALRSALSSYYEDRRIIFVFGAMRDKAIGEISEILFPLAESVIATCAENPRSATPEEIRAAASRTGAEIIAVDNVESALKRARILAGTDGVIVVTGSIYVVGEAIRVLGLETLGASGAADGK
jgi:dihydrofolate synthase/folylpolyglutamate synthase